MKHILLPAVVVLAASLCAGCTLETVDVSDVDAPAAEPASSRAATISVVGLSYSRGAFAVDIEVDEDILRDARANYFIAQLEYQPPEGAGVSPFSVTDIDDVRFDDLGRGLLAATLFVSGPPPRDIDDVVATVSANPTPHP